MEKILNYADGQLVEPINQDFFKNIDPATGKAYSLIPDSDAADVEKAVKAAESAFESWSSLTTQKRADYLLAISKKILEQKSSFVEAESQDNGKPVWLANQVDIPRAAANFRFFASGIQHFASESHAMQNQAVNYTLRDPLGVVGCISPWNLPLYLFTWKIAPALAAGNTVVAKPSEITPYTAYLLSKVCIEVGLPKGVLNIVHGYGYKMGDSITTHPTVKAISFTGGTKTGAHIASLAAPKFKKLSLELGGKNPTIIFEDCNWEKTLKTAVNSAFSNQGQICLCGSRIFVQQSIYEKFKKEFVAKIEKVKVGSPKEADSKMGALVSESHLEKVLGYVELAKEEGGTILTGGNRVELSGEFAEGYFMRPTVIEGLPYTCRTNQEEIFGPVVTITPFETEDEVVKMANSTEYGLAASIWTQDISRAHRMAKRVACGIIWINCWMLRDLRTPFGGMKSSGVGREGGVEALRFFTEPKNVCIDFGN